MDVTLRERLLLKMPHLSKPGLKILVYIIMHIKPDEPMIVVGYKAYSDWALLKGMDTMHRSDFSKGLKLLQDEGVLENAGAPSVYRYTQYLFTSKPAYSTAVVANERDRDL